MDPVDKIVEEIKKLVAQSDPKLYRAIKLYKRHGMDLGKDCYEAQIEIEFLVLGRQEENENRVR